MRIFKITLFILILLVVGLFFLQFRTAGGEDVAPILNSVSNSLPAEKSIKRTRLSKKPDGSAIALISASEKTDVPWIDRNPAAKRVRKIFPSPGWMTPDPVLKAGDVITLALFDDAVFEAKIGNVTVYPNGAVGLTAHLTGNELGTVYLSYCNQQLRASVEVPGGADYAIRYNAENKAHYAIEVDRGNSIILPDAESPVPDDVSQPEEETIADSPTASVVAADAPSGSTMIDVMIVYTPEALAYEGNVANMNDNIAEAMQRANEAHANSDTQIELRLVHSAEINYTESSASNGYSVDLDRLTKTSDGYMDEIHYWRDEYGADFVCLFEVNDDVGGYGQILQSQAGNSSKVFSLTRVQQSSWTYTMVHELGHNMGCHHSKTQTKQPGPGLHGYSAGWQWDDTGAASTSTGSSYYGALGYCSVMTYENHDGNGSGAGSCEYRRVAYFSNPDIDYTGDSTNPTGDAVDGDNARTMREMKNILADYRATMVPVDDADDDGLPNDWELLYFGGITNANPDAVASNGINTVMETYIAGLDPTDPNSLFTASLTDEAGFVVRWNAISGRVYSVFGTPDLLETFQTLENNIFWPQTSWTDNVPHTERFYKIDVQLQP